MEKDILALLGGAPDLWISVLNCGQAITLEKSHPQIHNMTALLFDL